MIYEISTDGQQADEVSDQESATGATNEDTIGAQASTNFTIDQLLK